MDLDMLCAICSDNLDKFRTLFSMQTSSDAKDLRNTLLHEAVKGNKKAITEFLLQVGSNPNSKVGWSFGSTALHIAAGNGNLEIIEMLLSHGADINADNDGDGTSPLVHAIRNEKDDATELLLERGARLFSDNEGKSPLHYAATRGSLKIIKMLLQNGAPVNAVITSGFEKGYTPLHCACSSYGFDIDIIEFLLSNEAGVDLKTEEGMTPLHIASQFGNVQVINLLLNYNADINVRRKNSYTPLFLATYYIKEDAALMLIKKGAKLDDEFSLGDTILGWALRQGLSSTVEEILTNCPDPQGEIAKCKELFRDLPEEMINILLKYCFDIEFLYVAIRQGYIQIIESVLKDRRELTANFDDIINSSLHIAVKSGRIESVEVLIANGADVNATTRTEKLTPLHVACESYKLELVQFFLDHKADVNLRDKNGKTALHFAASKYFNSAELLLENKANVNSQDFDGLTALHIAIDSKNYYVVKLLLNFGADINIKNRNNDKPMDILNRGRRYFGEMYKIDCLTLNHALALEAINLYYAKDLRSSLSTLDSSDQIKMESHFENCKQEIEKLKLVKVPGSQLTCYSLMTRSIHSVARYIKNEDLITHFQSDNFTTEFPIYAPIIQGRLRNAFQRRPLICGAGDFFNYYLKLPHVCVDHILSCLSSDDLKNVENAM